MNGLDICISPIIRKQNAFLENELQWDGNLKNTRLLHDDRDLIIPMSFLRIKFVNNVDDLLTRNSNMGNGRIGLTNKIKQSTAIVMDFTLHSKVIVKYVCFQMEIRNIGIILQ